MCDPVTAAGLALSAGGTFLQSREAAKNERRMANAKNQAFATHMIGQQKFADEAGAAFNHNTTKQGKPAFDEQQNAETQKMQEAFTEKRVQPDYNVGAGEGMLPKNVVLARQAASKEAGEETDRDVGNLSRLQSYSGALFNQGMEQNAFARLFGNVQDKAGADNRLLPLRMSAAENNAYKSPSLFPTLLKAAGQGMSMFGSMGGSFSNTVPGQMPAGVYGPGAPVTSYGIFMDKKPVDLFGYKLAGRYR